MKRGPKVVAPILRIMSMVRPASNGCLEWTGHTTDGYGTITLSEPRRKGRVHRVVFEHFMGQIPRSALVLHRCDNRRCCNLDHLFLGTEFENTADMVAKGRGWWQTRGRVRPALRDVG